MFHNRNVDNPNAWTFDPDPARPVINDTRNPDSQVRVTWQAAPTHKLAFMWYDTTNCFCPTNASATVALEAAARREYPLQRVVQGEWTSPFTNRLLFEGGVNHFWGESNDMPWPDGRPGMIQVTEQATGLIYRGAADGNRILKQLVPSWRFAVSYITGAHAFKAGVNDKGGHTEFHAFDTVPVSYRFNNGVPNQISQRAYPFDRIADVDHDLGVFVQDKWTVAGAGCATTISRIGSPSTTSAPRCSRQTATSRSPRGRTSRITTSRRSWVRRTTRLAPARRRSKWG
jgi:hypothetical protein